MKPRISKNNVAIIGGCGHVGLPLGLVLANKGYHVSLYDIDVGAVDLVNSSIMPFKEEGASELLKEVIGAGRLIATNDKSSIKSADVVIITLDTPLDAHLNPDVNKFINIVKELEPFFNSEQLLILRSTLYPGAANWIYENFIRQGKYLNIAFCPERIVEGRAIHELQTLPQIVSGCTEKSIELATDFFKTITAEIIVTSIAEAELAKLMTNTWRYISFAVANQFYMIASENNIDFQKLYVAMTAGYQRMNSFPTAGFSAGPCLVKDTMQLLNFANNQFPLGEAARQVNEGMPRFVVNQIKKTHDIKNMTVGILGMAFKADSDDPRQSLAYRLKKILEIEARNVICNDPHITNPRFCSIQEVINQSDVIIIGAPHKEYKGLEFNDKTLVVDIWKKI